MAEEQSVFGKFWFWLLIIGVILFVVAIISLVMKKYEWWVWTLLAVGTLMLIIGGVGWAMDSAEEKGTTVAGQAREEVVRVVHHLDPRESSIRQGSPRRVSRSPRSTMPPASAPVRRSPSYTYTEVAK